MCARFSITTPSEALRRLFGYMGPSLNFPPLYNITPTTEVPLILRGKDGTRALAKARFGLVPHWAKDIKMGVKMINARSETVAEKPAFRDPFRERRCLIPADGFYEWLSEDGAKKPYRAAFTDNRPFAFAGLWDAWQGPDGPIRSFSIITTEANDVLRPIHHRMPVILDDNKHEQWLGLEETSVDALHELLKPRDIPEFRPYRVSIRVNNVRNNDADLVEPSDD
jgi:putative SOS response-associated peptidase YedK